MLYPSLCSPTIVVVVQVLLVLGANELTVEIMKNCVIGSSFIRLKDALNSKKNPSIVATYEHPELTAIKVGAAPATKKLLLFLKTEAVDHPLKHGVVFFVAAVNS